MNTIESTERLSRQIARLNPTHVKFDIGMGGGTPELTAQDVAGAIGMVPDGMGRELLMHIHWPDAAKRNRKQLIDLMTLAQLGEYNRREAAMATALCRVATCDPADRHQATSGYAAAHANRWPLWVRKQEPLTFAEGYGRIRLAVLEELAHPRRCPECEGRDLIDRRGAPRTCERCMGQGTVGYGPSWRAEQLGMERAAFAQTWSEPYVWLFDLCRGEVTSAEDVLSRKLR